MPLDGRTAFSLISRVDDLREQSAWYLMCGPQDRLHEIADELCSEAALQGIASDRVPVAPVETLAERLRGVTAPLIVLEMESVAPDAVGHALEDLRSQLPLRKQFVLVLTSQDAGEVQRVAPHFASFIEEIESFAEDEIPVTSEAEVAHRLSFLQTSTGLSNEVVVALAIDGNLPSDPEYAEWLVMLGRGDLVP